MFESRGELLEQISLGEDSFLELKEVRIVGDKVGGPTQNDLADELAAFANTRGGVLLLGIHDKSRDVIGIPLDQLDVSEALVRQACEDSMKPPAAPVIKRMRLPDNAGVEHAIIRVDMPKSAFVHQSPGGYFHRIGASKRPIPPDQLARLFEHRSQARVIRFDSTPVLQATLDDLDENMWRRFVPLDSVDTPEILLSKLAMAKQDESGIWRPTVAGLLVASRDPQEFLSNAFIQAVAYRGTEISPRSRTAYQLDARDITGPLDQQIFVTCDFVRRNMRISATKNMEGGRIDIPQFDILAIFEAVANAVAHRDYSMSGSKIRLRIFEDRLELYSPGMLVNTMTTDTLPYRQSARNETISGLLARCPVERESIRSHRAFIMERRGEGVPIILSRSEQLSGIRPSYRLIDDSELVLTIHAPADCR